MKPVSAEGQYRSGAPRGVEQVGLRAKVPYQTSHCLPFLGCSTAFNSVKRAYATKEVSQSVHALTILVAKCYRKPADTYYQLESKESRRTHKTLEFHQ